MIQTSNMPKSYMNVIKRSNVKEPVSFDKILRRIEVLCTQLNLTRINAFEVTKDTINGLYDGITTEDIDHYAATNCSDKIRDDPQYDKLATALCVSRLHKMTDSDFMIVTQKLYDNELITVGHYNFVKENIEALQIVLDYSKDYDFDYFGLKTLEKSYLQKVKVDSIHRIIERPQHMFMRIAIALNMNSVADLQETYKYLSDRCFIFGSPTLYNAGSKYPQLSSCFLLKMDDNLESILDVVKECGLISKRAGGIGIGVSDIRASGSRIVGTNGQSTGIVPMIQVLNWLGRYINQGGKRNGAIACFRKDTEVFTANEGIKKIQDVKIGDLVVTHENRLKPVIQTHVNPLGDRKMYKLEVSKNKDIYVTGNHKFWSFYTKKNKSNKLSLGWNSIEELKNLIDNKGTTTRQTCYVTIPTGTNIVDLGNYKIDVMDYKDIIMTDMVNELKILDFDKVVAISNTINIKGHKNISTSKPVNKIWNITEDLANLFGIWLGDGCIRKSKTGGKVLGITISVHKDNKEEIGYINKVCKDVFGCNITQCTTEINNITNITINSHIIGAIFMELFGSYFDGKKLPNIVFSWPKNLITSLIAGLITSDGHITKEKCNAMLGLSNKNLIDQVYHLCRNNGIDVSFVEKKFQKGQTCTSYAISIPLSKEIINKTHKFYNDDRVERCKKKFENNDGIEDSNYLRILNITEIDGTDENVYTLGVEEDHSYTVEGLIVQNCYIEPWHADVFAFCELRSNKGNEEERARDIFLGLWIPDLFMKRVEEEGMWSLMCPNECPGLTNVYGDEFEKLYIKYEDEKKYRKQIPAKDLWFHILSQQIETGMPYMLYKDHINKQSNQKNLGVIKSSNLCAEIVEYTDENEIATCTLSSICLPRFVEDNDGELSFNYEKLKYVAGIVTRNLNSVIDTNLYPVEKAKSANLKHRPIGVGIQGLSDVYCMLGLPYDSDEARIINRKIFETIYYGALCMSNELAIKYGHYETFHHNGGCPFSKGLLQWHLWDLDESNLLMGFDWNTLIESIKKYGTRNSLLTTVMPTASTSQIMGNTESYEANASNVGNRTTLAGEFTVINKHLVETLIELGLWNKNVQNELLYDKGSVQNIECIPQYVKDIYKTAFELQNKPILIQSIERGPFIDQTQSFNMFCKVPDFDKLSSAHFFGWRGRLKTGMYYLKTQPAVDPINFGLDVEVINKIEKGRNIINNKKNNVEPVINNRNLKACDECAG